MLVVTTRQAAQDPGQLYSGERGAAISFDNIVVSIPPDQNRKIGEIQWPARIPANPEREFAVLNVQKVASDRQALEWFRRNRNARRQVIIFVHGFNNTYADAVFRFAQITHDAKINAAPILFTWPSRASVVDYLYDRESTTYSRRALEDLVIQVAKSPDVGEITILAHSMGAWLTMEALRGVSMRERAVPTKIGNVVLASPDIDVDVFRRQMIEMGPRRPGFTIFASTADKALDISRRISGGVNRVGGAAPAPYAGILKQLGITVIDTSTSDLREPLGHNAFADTPEIIALLGQRLSGQSLTSGQTGLADQVGIVAVGTANLANSAARAALALPMSAVSDSAKHILDQELSGMKTRIVDGQILY